MRIKFLPGQQRAFLDLIALKSSLSNFDLARLCMIHPRSFYDWRREKSCMPLLSLETLSEQFDVPIPEDKNMMIDRWKQSVSDRNRIGGIAFRGKYNSPGTVEGRSLGGRNSLSLMRKRGIIPDKKSFTLPSFSVELAEFLGIMLGDGSVTPYQCSITLNSIADLEYCQFVSELGEKLFGEKPKKYIYTNFNAVRLYYNGMSLSDYLVGKGLMMGNKVKQQVGVPGWIFNNREYRIACLRGLMDTDGGVFDHNYTSNGKRYSYKKICFTNRSVPLLKFVVHVLNELELGPKMVDKVENKKVWLYNEGAVARYFELVGSNNPRLLRRVARVVYGNGLLNRGA